MTKLSNFLKYFYSASVATFIFGSFLFAFTYLLPGAEVAKALDSKWTPPVGKFIQGVNIANSGMIYIQGAKVLSVSGNQIVVSVSWNVVKMQWTVNTNESYYNKRHFGTGFLDSKGNRVFITDIHAGDIISVSGVLDTNFADPTIKADFVRTP